MRKHKREKKQKKQKPALLKGKNEKPNSSKREKRDGEEEHT